MASENQQNNFQPFPDPGPLPQRDKGLGEKLGPLFALAGLIANATSGSKGTRRNALGSFQQQLGILQSLSQQKDQETLQQYQADYQIARDKAIWERDGAQKAFDNAYKMKKGEAEQKRRDLLNEKTDLEIEGLKTERENNFAGKMEELNLKKAGLVNALKTLDIKGQESEAKKTKEELVKLEKREIDIEQINEMFRDRTREDAHAYLNSLLTRGEMVKDQVASQFARGRIGLEGVEKFSPRKSSVREVRRKITYAQYKYLRELTDEYFDSIEGETLPGIEKATKVEKLKGLERARETAESLEDLQ